MAFTVLTTRVAQPGRGDALIAAILANWQTSHLPHSRTAWVLQGRQDRDRILVLSEWEDRQAFMQRPRVVETSPALALCLHTTRLPLQRLHFYEEMGSRKRRFTCHRLTFPHAQRAQVLHLLQAEKLPRLRPQPELLLRYLYAVVDEPGQFVVLQGWTNGAAWEEARRVIAPVYAAATAAGLDLRDEAFVGRVRGEWDGAERRWRD
jgi:hypothetical protein